MNKAQASAPGEDVIGFETRLICADGSIRRFVWNTRTVPGLGLRYGTARDMTERTALADAQAALRRVARLVAGEPSPDEVFAAVVDEVGRIVGVESTAMIRFDPYGTPIIIASRGKLPVPVGSRLPLDEDGIGSRMFKTAQASRIDDSAASTGTIPLLSDFGIRSAARVPIIVGGKLWGAMVAFATQPLPEHTESRMAQFTELVATAIANTDARSALAASRARIVAAADDERRRVVRDLHDGAQQSLVVTVLMLNQAQQALQKGADDAPVLVDQAIMHAEQALDELRELAHGILPSVLTQGGLRAGVKALGSRTPVPVAIKMSVDRLPAPVEATAYFVVAEALTNIAKHASARRAEVVARIADGALRLEIRDDGRGGVPADGSGLVGLADRLAALDGRLEIDSPRGGGTCLSAVIPLPAQSTG